MEQRTYEVMFIVRPDMQDEDVDKLVANLESNANTAGAKIQATERWGKRKLAYDVRRFSEGNYILMKVDADGKAIHEVERPSHHVRVDDDVHERGLAAHQVDGR